MISFLFSSYKENLFIGDSHDLDRFKGSSQLQQTEEKGHVGKLGTWVV